MALVLHQVGAAQTRTLLQQVGDTANLALDGLTTGLGGMCGKDRVKLELVEQLVGALDTHLVYQLVIATVSSLAGSTSVSVDAPASRSRSCATR